MEIWVHSSAVWTDTCNSTMIRKKSTQGEKQRIFCVFIHFRWGEIVPFFSENSTSYETSRRKKIYYFVIRKKMGMKFRIQRNANPFTIFKSSKNCLYYKTLILAPPAHTFRHLLISAVLTFAQPGKTRSILTSPLLLRFSSWFVENDKKYNILFRYFVLSSVSSVLYPTLLKGFQSYTAV